MMNGSILVCDRIEYTAEVFSLQAIRFHAASQRGYEVVMLCNFSPEKIGILNVEIEEENKNTGEKRLLKFVDYGTVNIEESHVRNGLYVLVARGVLIYFAKPGRYNMNLIVDGVLTAQTSMIVT